MIFDGYIMTNWSGAASPASIFFIGFIDGKKIKEEFKTRQKARDYLTSIMDKAKHNGQRLLLGFDFPFGYPADAYGEFSCKDWKALWALIHGEINDDISGKRNKNNRFCVAAKLNKKFKTPGPFWGHPQPEDNRYDGLPYRKPKGYGDTLPKEFRYVEKKLREINNINPLSVWKLFHGVSVGSKTLMGIPTLYKLQKRADCLVWPFDDLEDNKHVIAEIYPSIWTERNNGLGIKARICIAAETIACLDKKGDLQDLLKAPDSYDRNMIKKEGWILGIDKMGRVKKCP